MSMARNRLCMTAIKALLLALAAVPVLAAEDGDMERGRQLFLGCIACHAIKGKGGKAGPDLAGLFGRKAGRAAGYDGYSAVMKAADFVWTEARLEDWLADPNGFLPGNVMSYPGLGSARDRMDLIAWLRVETAP